MRYQYDFVGGSSPQNLNIYVCPRCYDDLAWQFKLLILPPDPPPLMNTYPEPYAVDETSWLTTQSGNVLTTEGGNPLVIQNNPDDNPEIVQLVSALSYPSGSVASVYLDIFIGDPSLAGAQSVLVDIAGSTTRSDIGPSLQTSGNIATNPSVLVVTGSSVSTVNVEYIGLYSSATPGSSSMSGLLAYGPVSANFPTVVAGYPVQFDALGLSIDLS